LKLFPGFESDCLSGRNVGDLSGSWVSTDAALSWLYDEHAEAAQFNSLAALKRFFHRLEQRLDGYLGLDFGNSSLIGNLIDYI
jgi:hypothetical protein